MSSTGLYWSIDKNRRLPRDAPAAAGEWAYAYHNMAYESGIHLNRLKGVTFAGEIQLAVGCKHCRCKTGVIGVLESVFADRADEHTHRLVAIDRRKWASYVDDTIKSNLGIVLFNVVLVYRNRTCRDEACGKVNHANTLIVLPANEDGTREAMLYDPHGSNSRKRGAQALAKQFEDWKISSISNIIPPAALSSFSIQDILDRGCCMDLASIVVHYWLLLRQHDATACLQSAQESLVRRFPNPQHMLMQYREMLDMNTTPDQFFEFFEQRGHRWTCTCGSATTVPDFPSKRPRRDCEEATSPTPPPKRHKKANEVVLW
jgi:hypothetical protein